MKAAGLIGWGARLGREFCEVVAMADLIILRSSEMESVFFKRVKKENLWVGRKAHSVRAEGTPHGKRVRPTIQSSSPVFVPM